MRVTHGRSGTPHYECWSNMKRRVNVDPNYAGVVIDERWQTYEGFRANPPTVADGWEYEPGLCLSRLNDTGPYSPENARWRTRVQNLREQDHPTKSHCAQGHEYTEANTKIDSAGKRRCRICLRAKQRRYRTGS